MQKNNILDYEQVESILQKITQNGIIKKVEDIGKTKYNLPIKHYIAGSGSKDIVITGATHSSEIISTDFVIKLMQEISGKNSNWEGVLRNFRIHFIPILNPEGYLIVASAIRKLIPRDMEQDEAEKICKQYYLEYRQDDINPIKTKKESATSSNDIFRIMYPKDLLVELSGMGGNPIGPYGDIKGNYTNAMQSNLSAVNYTLKVANIAQIISEASYKVIKKLQGNQDYDKVTQVQDIIYQEFSEKVQQLENIQYSKEQESKGYDRDE